MVDVEIKCDSEVKNDSTMKETCDSCAEEVYAELDKLIEQYDELIQSTWNDIDEGYAEHSENTSPSVFMKAISGKYPHDVRKSWLSLNCNSSFIWMNRRSRLIRVRCMIQDSLGPEYFPGLFKIKSDDGKYKYLSGVLRDSFPAINKDDIVHQVYGERHCFVMVPVPGVNSWYESTFADKIDCEIKESDVHDKFIAKFNDEEAEKLLPNMIVDVYGIITDHGVEKSEEEDTESGANWPNVPNVHVIHYEVVNGPSKDMISCLPSIESTLSHLRSILFDCIGDELVADYLCLYMLSTTYSRTGGANLCTLPLNICGVTKDSHIIHDIINTFIPKSKTLKMDTVSLSSKPFHSVKDYTTNRLIQGEYQVSAGTYLIIDETLLGNEKIFVRDHAEANMSTLHKIISEQRIEYDFKYYRCPFDVDIPVIVISKERSKYIATPYRIGLPTHATPTLEPINKLKYKQLSDIRYTLMDVKEKLKDIELTKEFAEQMTSELTKLAQDESYKMISDEKAEHFSRILMLVRLISAMRGDKQMGMESFKMAVDMEKRREESVDRFPVLEALKQNKYIKI